MADRMTLGVRPSTPDVDRNRAAKRTDIQALRAIAVALVLCFHLWPHGLTGGFAGVDVFFVISGFLITSHLLSNPPSRPREFAAFWARRIRRLLPAAFLVLTATLVGSRLFAPDTQWTPTARHVAAAAAYVVNWVLASDSVDYLASQAAPSPVEHFWSLSVEEQFYLVWPLLIGVLFLLARRFRIRRLPTVLVGLAVVVLVSLSWSIHETATNPAAAYFVTPTRMWELGAGGLLAAAITLRGTVGLGSPVARRVLAWAGLALIGYTALRYNQGTPFPSWQAAVPVLGAVALIGAAQTRDSGALGRVFAIRPVQWLGDISYSVYLWHWPMVVLVPQATGHPLTNPEKIGIAVTTLLLAHLTMVWVENPFRSGLRVERLRTTYVWGAVGMALVIGLCLVQRQEVHQRLAADQHRLAAGLDSHSPCFGAPALSQPAGSCPPTPYADIVPAPALAAVDKSNAYADVSHGKNCWSSVPNFRDIRCAFGDRHGSKTIELVGNSHAGEWLPPLESLARARHWRIVTRLASQCAVSDIVQALATPAESQACRTWAEHTTSEVVADHPDLVLMINRISVSAAGHTFAQSGAVYRSGYESVLRAWSQAGLRVVTLHDTPAPGDGGVQSVPDCVAEHPDSLASCGGARSTWEPADPIGAAVRSIGDPLITTTSLNDHICTRTRCEAVVGGVIVYFDGSHLTATYGRTLAPYLGSVLDKALRQHGGAGR